MATDNLREMGDTTSDMNVPAFQRYIGIDYSGAETPDSSLKGLRACEADRESLPVEIEPQPSPRNYWTRRGLAEWLVDRLSEDVNLKQEESLFYLRGREHSVRFRFGKPNRRPKTGFRVVAARRQVPGFMANPSPSSGAGKSGEKIVSLVGLAGSGSAR